MLNLNRALLLATALTLGVGTPRAIAAQVQAKTMASHGPGFMRAQGVMRAPGFMRRTPRVQLVPHGGGRSDARHHEARPDYFGIIGPSPNPFTTGAGIEAAPRYHVFGGGGRNRLAIYSARGFRGGDKRNRRGNTGIPFLSAGYGGGYDACIGTRPSEHHGVRVWLMGNAGCSIDPGD